MLISHLRGALSARGGLLCKNVNASTNSKSRLEKFKKNPLKRRDFFYKLDQLVK